PETLTNAGKDACPLCHLSLFRRRPRRGGFLLSRENHSENQTKREAGETITADVGIAVLGEVGDFVLSNQRRDEWLDRHGRLGVEPRAERVHAVVKIDHRKQPEIKKQGED